MIALQFPLLSNTVLAPFTVMEVRLLQLKKASLPMEVTLLGMVREVRLVQSEKA